MNVGVIVKSIVRFASATSASAVVTNVIKANTPANLTKFEKGLSMVGEFVVSGVIGDLAAEYVVKQIESFEKKKEKPQLECPNRKRKISKKRR